MFDEVATRKHFITQQGCRNACRKIRDFTNHQHNNDAISVDRIVRELQLEDPSPVIGYKPRGIKDERYPLLMEENFLPHLDDRIPSHSVQKVLNVCIC